MTRPRLSAFVGCRVDGFIAHLDPPPYRDRPLFVFTHRQPQPRDGVTFCTLTPAEAVQEWRATGLTHVYVDGGQVVSAFLEAGLLDAITLTTVPVILGDGIPLFGRHAITTALQLESTRTWRNGVVARTYSRAEQTPLGARSVPEIRETSQRGHWS